jgi:hypothetical protein
MLGLKLEKLCGEKSCPPYILFIYGTDQIALRRVPHAGPFRGSRADGAAAGRSIAVYKAIHQQVHARYGGQTRIIVQRLSESRSWRILRLLEELGLSYEILLCFREEHTNTAPPGLRRIHPLDKSPVISDDGTVISGSGATSDYLSRKHSDGRLEP